jgi:hypothetical protein
MRLFGDSLLPLTLDQEKRKMGAFAISERRIFMYQRMSLYIIGIALLALSVAPSSVSAQQAVSQEPGVHHYAGSVILSVFYLPLKLVTCVGTQVVAGTAYIATYQVPGSYEGGTNGKNIGEVASGSCSGAWVISPEQVQRDYR